MPSKKGIDQALTWLKSKATERNTLDGVNAELCINVIMDLQRQYDQLGAKFNNISSYQRQQRELAMRGNQLSFLEDDGK